MSLKELSRKPKAEIEMVRSGLNLTDDEQIVFEMSIKDKSIQQIADKLSVSPRTANRRKKSLALKLSEYEIMARI